MFPMHRRRSKNQRSERFSVNSFDLGKNPIVAEGRHSFQSTVLETSSLQCYSNGMKHKLFAFLLGAVATVGMLYGQTAKEEIKEAGAATKKAGTATVKATGKTTVEVGKKTGEVTVKGAKKTGTATKKASKKVASATVTGSKKVANVSAEKVEQGAKKVEGATK